MPTDNAWLAEIEARESVVGAAGVAMVSLHTPERDRLCAALQVAWEREQGADKLQQIVAGHLQDERQRHRRTRELLAAQFGVEVDTEAYDTAYDAAVAALAPAERSET